MAALRLPQGRIRHANRNGGIRRIDIARHRATSRRRVARPFPFKGNISAPHAELAEPRAAAATTLSNSPPDRMSFYIWN
ncbi:hypothetical protein C7S16_1964 [Burkholderia thailandensis]|uniref:Uncharacterized protein n=1 Tax=Burkholderia thailandensis TaxID=57975 RepID=A0AAW9D0F8_BURTH|nr:hypothetical protein [Burkholderia thailandensis]